MDAMKIGIPGNTSAVALLAGARTPFNRIEDGCKITDDGWIVYADGTRKKWLERFGSGTRQRFVWRPYAVPVARAERLYTQARRRADAIARRYYAAALAALPVEVRATGGFVAGQRHGRRFYVGVYPPAERGFVSLYVSTAEDPPAVECQPAIDAWGLWWERTAKANDGYLWLRDLFSTVGGCAVRAHVEATYAHEQERQRVTQVRLRVNGREYPFVRTPNSNVFAAGWRDGEELVLEVQ